MEKIYTIENLDCANCAAKAEEKIRKLPGVEDASITFATMQLRLVADDPDEMLPAALAAARQIEPDIRFLPKSQLSHHHECHCHHHEHNCDCGHDHDHHEHNCGCGCDHHHHDHHPHHHEKSGLPGILLGAGLFVAGLIVGSWLPVVSAVLFVAAWVLLGGEVLLKAGKNLIRGKVFDENFLMSIATIGAFAIGEFAEAVGIMLFYRIGEYFEHKAMERSRSQIMEAVDLRPEVVTLENGETIPAQDAKPGDILTVRPGDRIPLDSVVVSGQSRMDTAAITGESMPVAVYPGAKVTSGCMNLDGVLTIEVEKPLSESMVTRILNAVQTAAAGKPKIDKFITRFSRVYTPAVVVLALLTAIVPSLISGNWSYWVYTALSFLVMSCPCALVLSVPLAFFCGIGKGSKKGILFKGGASMEALSQVKAVVMDKTGTLTKGDFSVQQLTGDSRILQICAACEQHSSHPIAQSIVAAAKEKGLPLPQPSHIEELPGMGIRATLESVQVLCGNEKLMAQHGIAVETAENYAAVVWVAAESRLLGHILISDTIKPDARDAVNQLHAMGIHTAMLTGDREESAKAVADSLGIRQVHARLLPEQKLSVLQNIRKENGAVMFVGDGINDAVVLAGADVGAAMGSGADAAIEAADVVFMTGAAGAIPEAITIARKTRQIAWQNVIFALGIKLAVMVLGLAGLASMWAAVFADSGVAMLCVINAISLLYRKK